jgi:hypothetical protein
MAEQHSRPPPHVSNVERDAIRGYLMVLYVMALPT